MATSDQVSAVLGRIREVMAIPAPREVPSDVSRLARNPVTRFLLYFEGAWTLAILVLLAIFAWRRDPVVLILLPLFLVSLGITLAAAYWSSLTRKALSQGRLWSGKVTKVSPLPARIGGRVFFRAEVEFEGGSGERLRGRDTVDSDSVEYFLNARDRSEPIDVIHAPNPVGKVVLPMRMAIGNRYD